MVDFVCVLLWLRNLRTDANATTGGERFGRKATVGHASTMLFDDSWEWSMIQRRYDGECLSIHPSIHLSID